MQDAYVSSQTQQPESLPDPVPTPTPTGETVATDDFGFPNLNINTPTQQAQPQAQAQAQPAPDPAAAAEDNLGFPDLTQQQPVAMDGEFPNDVVEEDPGFWKSQALQFRDEPLRSAVGLLSTYKKKTKYLQDVLGKKNVKTVPGEDNHLVRKSIKDEFHKLDSEDLEFPTDLYADESREAVKFAGAAYGAGALAKSTEGNAIMKGLGFIAGGTIGGTGAALLLQPVTEILMNIPRESQEGGTQEDPLTGYTDKERTQLLMARERFQDAMSQGAVTTAVASVFKVGGIVLGKAKSNFLEMKKIRQIPPTETALEDIRIAKAGAELVDASPGVQNIPNSPHKVGTHYIMGDSDAVYNDLVNTTMTSNEGQKIQEVSVANVVTAVDSYFTALMGKPAGYLKKTFQSIPKGNLTAVSSNIKKVLKDVKKEEGTKIGEMIRAAESAVGDKKSNILIDNSHRALKEILAEYPTIQEGPNGLIFPEGFDKIVKNRLLTTKASSDSIALITEDFKNILNTIHNYKNGIMPNTPPNNKNVLDIRTGYTKPKQQLRKSSDLADFNQFYDEVDNFAAARAEEGGPLSAFSARLAQGMRADRIDTIDIALSRAPHLVPTFADPITKYRAAMQLESLMGNVLQNSLTAQKSLVKGVFRKDVDGYERVVQLKAFLEKHEPETWSKVKTAFIDEIAERSRVPGKPGNIDMTKFRNELFGANGFGIDYVNMIGGNKHYSANLNKVLMLGERVERLLVKGDGENARGVWGEIVKGIPALINLNGPSGINSAAALLRFGST